MKNFALDGRLLSVAKFVRQGAQFADIGTDHAYLPLALLADGRISSAVCSDINEGPLESARANARACGLTDKIEFILTDGAEGLSGFGITDAAIAGMGGELIADIIGRAPFFRNKNIRLILQPMSKQGHLRRYLAAEGFGIFAEDYSESNGKHYITLAVCYTGACAAISDTEAEFGDKRFLHPLSEEARGYLLEKRAAYSKICRGKMLGGEGEPKEKLFLNFVNDILAK